MMVRVFSKIIFLLPIVSIVACAKVTLIPEYNMAEFNQDIEHIYKNPKSHSVNLSERLKADSQPFVGKAYLLGALGDGKQALFDKSPLYRTDVFDCTTFVSTILAFVQSDNLTAFKENILKIRYKNNLVSFVDRNHFISVDWNLNNEKNGYLSDVTRSVLDRQGNSIAVKIETLIDRPNWFCYLPMDTIKVFSHISKTRAEKLLQKLHALSADVKPQRGQLYYLPMNRLFTNGKPNQYLFNQIPSNVIIEIVRQDKNLKKIIGTNLNISHMGLGIRINNQLIFRGASIVDKTVRDMPLKNYLTQFLSDPMIKGIHIEKMQLKM